MSSSIKLLKKYGELNGEWGWSSISRLLRDRSNNKIKFFIFKDQGTFFFYKQREMEPEAKTEEIGKNKIK